MKRMVIFMKLARKAQLSWFVVLGIIFLIIILILSWLAYSSQFSKSKQIILSEDEAGNVKSYLESCEKELIEEALILIGNQGGMVNPENFFEVENNKVALETPSLEEISNDIEDYIDKNIVRKCNPETVTEKDVEVSRPKTEVSFNDKETVVEVAWPVTLFFENETEKTIGAIKTFVPVRMKLVHETVQGLEEKTNLNFVDSLDSMDVKKISYDGRILGIIVDHKSKVRDRPYKFFYIY